MCRCQRPLARPLPSLLRVPALTSVRLQGRAQPSQPFPEIPMRPVLVTAGATRNPVDAIRYLSAGSSGRTGLEIARGLAAQGHDVDVLGSEEAALRAPQGQPVEVFGSTRDLQDRMRAWLSRHPAGLVVHSAAVGDYEVEAVDHKLPSNQSELLLRLSPAPKILDQLREWAPGCKVVSFKAASPETTPDALVVLARKQLRRTGSSIVFANVIGRLEQSATVVDATRATAYRQRKEALSALVHAASVL